MRILVSTLCLSLLIATAATAKIVFAATHADDANASSIYMMEDDGTGVTPPLTTGFVVSVRLQTRTYWVGTTELERQN